MKLKKRLNKLNEAALELIDKHSSRLIGILSVVIVLSGYTLFSVYQDNISTPLSVKEFAATSVKITNLAGTSGGSGSVYKSTTSGTLILTNEHVCKLVTNGGVISHQSGRYLVMTYKMYAYHDLCLIRIRENLGVNTTVAVSRPDIYDRAHISGHPALLPHVLTEGNFSGNEIINVLIGTRPCRLGDDRMLCFFFGGIPIIKTYETQLVTGTILPGSSGSAVFNSDGQIAGVVFAGRSRELSYAYIVPHAYVNHFIKTQDKYKEKQVNYQTSIDGKSQESVKSVCKADIFNRTKICRNAIEVLVWEL